MNFQKVSAYLLITTIIIELTGCYSIKTLPKSNLLPYNKEKNYYVHSGNKIYHVTNPSILNRIFIGTIDYKKIAHSPKKAIHLYIAPDTILKTNETSIHIPLENIVKVETSSINGSIIFTILGGAGYALTTALAILIIITHGGHI